MPDRPYKCPVCDSAFRNESGMKWHLTHRHETPIAFDALSKEHTNETVGLRDENTLLAQKLKLSEEENTKYRQLICAATEAWAKDRDTLGKAYLAIATRDILIKEKLNFEMKDPFE